MAREQPWAEAAFVLHVPLAWQHVMMTHTLISCSAGHQADAELQVPRAGD